MYFADGTWSEGIASAAKLVAEATKDFCEAGNQASKNMLDIEFVTVSARNVSAATVKLITAASVRGDNKSQAHSRLKIAGKAVTDAISQFVAAADSMSIHKNEQALLPAGATSDAKAKAAEMEAQVKILKMEKELERARMQLGGMRKAKYQTSTKDLSPADEGSNRKLFLPPKELSNSQTFPRADAPKPQLNAPAVARKPEKNEDYKLTGGSNSHVVKPSSASNMQDENRRKIADEKATTFPTIKQHDFRDNLKARKANRLSRLID